MKNARCVRSMRLLFGPSAGHLLLPWMSRPGSTTIPLQSHTCGTNAELPAHVFTAEAIFQRGATLRDVSDLCAYLGMPLAKSEAEQLQRRLLHAILPAAIYGHLDSIHFVSTLERSCRSAVDAARQQLRLQQASGVNDFDNSVMKALQHVRGALRVADPGHKLQLGRTIRLLITCAEDLSNADGNSRNGKQVRQRGARAAICCAIFLAHKALRLEPPSPVMAEIMLGAPPVVSVSRTPRNSDGDAPHYEVSMSVSNASQHQCSYEQQIVSAFKHPEVTAVVLAMLHRAVFFEAAGRSNCTVAYKLSLHPPVSGPCPQDIACTADQPALVLRLPMPWPADVQVTHAGQASQTDDGTAGAAKTRASSGASGGYAASVAERPLWSTSAGKKPDSSSQRPSWWGWRSDTTLELTMENTPCRAHAETVVPPPHAVSSAAIDSAAAAAARHFYEAYEPAQLAVGMWVRPGRHWSSRSRGGTGLGVVIKLPRIRGPARVHVRWQDGTVCANTYGSKKRELVVLRPVPVPVPVPVPAPAPVPTPVPVCDAPPAAPLGQASGNNEQSSAAAASSR